MRIAPNAAKAREVSAKLAASSEIDGENTTVAQLAAQLDDAQWELDQTTVRAPSDGFVAASTLAVVLLVYQVANGRHDAVT